MYFVYVLRCVDSSLYCGYTVDVARRVASHLGKAPGGAKYTKSHVPTHIACVWSCEDKRDACRLEYRFKRLPKEIKEALVSGGESFEGAFSGVLDPSVFERRRELEGAL